jgi:hypothetical protein
MLPYRNNKIAAIAILLFFLAVIGYAYFEARNILYGPQINIGSPDAPLSVHEPLIHIRGQAANITELRMNGDPVSVTEAGAFDEALLLAVGYNKVMLTASDKFGRSTSRSLEILYSPASTTATSSDSIH